MAVLTIQWLGFSAVRIQAKVEDEDVTVLTDPFPSSAGLRMPRNTEAELLLLSKSDVDTESVSGTPFVIRGPGEYEVRKIFVYGIPSGQDTHYRIEAGDLSIAYLGGARTTPSDAAIAQLEDADVLLIPVGGGDLLSAKDAAKIVTALEPRIVLPIAFAPQGSGLKLDSAAAFFREVGASGERVDKIKVQRKDLPQEQTVFYELTIS